MGEILRISEESHRADFPHLSVLLAKNRYYHCYCFYVFMYTLGPEQSPPPRIIFFSKDMHHEVLIATTQPLINFEPTWESPVQTQNLHRYMNSWKETNCLQNQLQRS